MRSVRVLGNSSCMLCAVLNLELSMQLSATNYSIEKPLSTRSLVLFRMVNWAILTISSSMWEGTTKMWLHLAIIQLQELMNQFMTSIWELFPVDISRYGSSNRIDSSNSMVDLTPSSIHSYITGWSLSLAVRHCISLGFILYSEARVCFSTSLRT